MATKYDKHLNLFIGHGKTRILNKIANEIHRENKAYAYDLIDIINALSEFLPEYENIRINPALSAEGFPCMLLLDKSKETIKGEDISNREYGLVCIIEEIITHGSQGPFFFDDLDLTISGQHLIIPKLLEMFPDCQFFIATHSMIMPSYCMPEQVFIMDGDDYEHPQYVYGMNLNNIAIHLFGQSDRCEQVQEALDTSFEYIERKEYTKATALTDVMKTYMPHDYDLIRAQMLLRREKMR